MVALKRFPSSFMSTKDNSQNAPYPNDPIIHTYQTGRYWLHDTPRNLPWIFWKFAESSEPDWYYLKSREDPEGFLTIIDYTEEQLGDTSKYKDLYQNSTTHNKNVPALSYVKSLSQSQDRFLFRPNCLITEERKSNLCQIEAKAYQNAVVLWQTTKQQLPMQFRTKSQYFGLSHCSNTRSHSAASFELEDTYFRFTDNVT